MAWIKFHDDFFTHPRTADLPAAAVGLHLRAICYSNQHLLDGRVPLDVIASWGYARWRHSSDILLTLGVWTMSGECIEIRDYLDYQRSRAQVLETRETRAKAGAKGGKAKAANAKQTPSKVLDGALAEKKRIEPPSSPPATDPATLTNAAAYGGEEDLLRHTFAFMATFDLERARAEGVVIRTTDGFLAAAAARRRDEHETAARAHLAQHPTASYYPLHEELAERCDPTVGPADGGLARANAKAEAARLARKAEAASRGPRSNSGAAAAREALALHPDQGAA